MTAIDRCAHENTEPVYAYLHGPSPKVGDEVVIANGGQPVARICVDCYEGVHVGWGCTDCEWDTVEIKMLCQLVPDEQVVLRRPCAAHRESGWAAPRRSVIVPG